MDKNNEKSSIIIKKQYQFMNKLEENLKVLCPSGKNQANQARYIYEAMETPIVDDLKSDDSEGSNQ